MHTLRTAGLRVNMGSGSLKSQMKQADRAGAPLVIICGENELAEGKWCCGIWQPNNRKMWSYKITVSSFACGSFWSAEPGGG